MAIENAKTLNVRIRNKYDSYENWAASSLVLEAGEIAIAYTSVDVKVDNGTAKHPALLMKVGDGEKTFANLPWMSAKAADVLAVCKDEAALTTFVNGVIANAGIATNDALTTLAGKVTTAEGEIDALQAELDTAETGLKARVTTAEGAIDALEALVGDTKVATQIANAIAELNLANTYDAKGAAAAVEAKLNTHASEAAAAYETKTDASAKLTEAKGYTDTEVAKVQGEVDALEAYVGTIPTNYTEETVIAYINKKAEETLAAAQGGSSETAASVKQQLDNYKSENDTRVKAAEDAIDAIEADYLKAADKTALQDQIDALDLLVGDDTVSKQITDVTNPLAARVKAVEDDYLKAADKTELEGKITTNANAIERLTNGVSAEEVDGVNDLIQYVNDHGTEVTGMKADIKANADAIDAIEADYLKAADKNELSGLITGLDTRMGAAETAIGTKAAQADLTALAGRVATVEGDLNTETTGLKARMAAAESDIDALETKVGDKTVAAQIEAAIEALKIGDYAKAADLTAAINQHNTDKATLETEIAKKANTADLAAIAKTGNVNDLVQTEGDVLIFDCGTSV